MIRERDEDFIITVDLQLPKDHINESEIRLVTACLGDLLKRVIRETETVKE